MKKKTAAIQRLIIGIFPDLSPSKISITLKSIKEAIPFLDLELTDHDAPSDTRITPDMFKGDNEIFLPLWEEDYQICMHKNHPLAETEFLFIEDLHNYDFIECPPCDVHQHIKGFLSSSGLKLNVVAKAEHKSQVMHLIRAGFGISFLPEGVLEYSQNLVTIPLKGVNHKSAYLLWPTANMFVQLIASIQ